MPLGGWKGPARACRPQHVSWWWGYVRRGGGEPEKLGGERLRPRQPPPPPPPRGSWREGEELTERCREEELRGEALELRWWWWWWWGELVRLQMPSREPPCWAAERAWWSGELRAEPPCISWARQDRRSESLLLLARIR